MVRDHWGMIRYIPGVLSRDERVSAEAGRIAASHKIQSMAQGMIQNSMVWLRDRIWEMQDAGLAVDWRLQIHDELILLCDEEIAETVKDLLLEGLTKHSGVKLRVPVLAEANIAKTWGGLKG